MKRPTCGKMEYHSPAEHKVIVTAVIVMIVLSIVDQITKWAVVSHIEFGKYVCVIPNYFDLTYIQNKGAAWGLFHEFPWIPASISVLAFFLLMFFFRKMTEGWIERYFALALVCSGIIGNCTDRIIRGAVVDFLRFHWHQVAEWPSFNVADSAICCGIAVYVISSLVRPIPDSTNKNESRKTIQDSNESGSSEKPD